MTPTPNTPSREAMDAAREYYFTAHTGPHAASYIATDGNSLLAVIIDRHIAPLHTQIAQLWKSISEYQLMIQDYKPAELAEARAKLARLRNGAAPTDDAKGTPETDALGLKDLKVMREHARDLERRLTQSREEVAALKYWKESAMQVEAQWDCQAVGKLIDAPLGGDIRSRIEPAIIALRSTVAALQRDKERYEFCKKHMFVCTHGLAPGVTDVSMLRIASDIVYLSADQIIDRAMLPGTKANVRAMIDAALSAPKPEGNNPIP